MAGIVLGLALLLSPAYAGLAPRALVASAAAETTPPIGGQFRYLGSMPFEWEGNKASVYQHIVVDPATKAGPRAFLYTVDGQRGMRVLVYDLTTLALVAELEPPLFQGIIQQGLNATAAAFDPVNHRIIYPPGVPPQLWGTCGQTGRLQVLDTDELTWRSLTIPCYPDGDFTIDGASYDPETNRAYLVGFRGGTESAAAALTPQVPGRPYYIRTVEVPLDPEATVAPLASRDLPISPCNKATSFIRPLTGAAVGRHGDTVYVACEQKAPQSGQGVMLAARLLPDGTLNGPPPPLDTETLPPPRDDLEMTPTLGGGTVGPSFDAVGAKMLFLSNTGANGVGTFVLDAPSGLFDGVVSTGTARKEDLVRAFGFDESRGRVYMLTKSNLLSSDVRHRPLPAGRKVAGITDTREPDTEGEETGVLIGVDPLRHRLYIPDFPGREIDVYEDVLPVAPKERVENPDENTNDLPEEPGKTGRTYSASGNAYGFYLRSEGGPMRALDNNNPSCTSARRDGCFDGREDGPEPGGRDWFFGQVADLALTDGGASASAHGVHFADRATKLDFERMGGLRDGARALGLWPPEGVACQDFGQSPSGEDSSSRSGSAEVACDADGARVDAAGRAGGGASAEAEAFPVRVAYADSSVESFLDPERGLVTRATAVARGVTLGDAGTGQLSIDEIRSEAETVAKGRPDTAGATYTRSIEGVSAPGFSCGDNCDPRQVRDAINRTLGFRVRALLPEPDPAYYPDGSKGGYQALVTKDERLQTSERAVNGDQTDTVVALEIVVYSDGASGRAREIFQFAGVHAESHYGIYPLAAGFPTSPNGSSSAPSPPALGAPSGPAAAPSPGPLARMVAGQDGYYVDEPILAGGARPAGGGSGDSGPGGFSDFVRDVADSLRHGWRFLVSHPGQAGLLAALLSIAGAPLYLALRRRDLKSGLSLAPSRS